MKKFLFDEESGQGMVEYGLILALIAVVCIVAFTQIGTKTNAKLGNVSKALD
jgi:pilus assembly protein Flp/PilA